jgi:hypothetical protein
VVIHIHITIHTQDFSESFFNMLESCGYGTVQIGQTDTTSKFLIVDKSGTPINGTFPVRRIQEQCTVPALEELNGALDIAMTKLDEARSEDDLMRGMATMDLVGSSEGVEGCMTTVNNMVVFGVEKGYLPGMRGCFLEEDDPAFELDPCCNWELTSTQCCPLRDLEVNETVIKGTVDEEINKCKPEYIQDVKQALLSYQSFYNAQNSKSDGCNASRGSLKWK